ncbi:proline-rich basic protein 1 [Ornithorhynchus anatinus]|uniref:proline-rich basic protein 1 n=1 Tax=Ornithorhynchus anatinus TaxID=9258 RepID=UPI0010A80129|nr:proline-rich basic protein 1 [Ornithorhynchus anatinus]
MLAAAGPTPGVPPAPTPRRDSSGSSGSYHTAPGSPEPGGRGGPRAGAAGGGGRTRRPPGAPGAVPEAQPLLSVSAQNSRRGRPGSGFGPRPGPRPPRVRTLPSGEMEVIFSPGPLGGPPGRPRGGPDPSGGPAARRPRGLRLDVRDPGPAPPSPGSSPAPSDGGGNDDDDDDDDDGGPGRSAAYLDPRASPPAPPPGPRFECVEVALEDEAPPRTVPKRQIELREKPRAPGPAAGRGPLLRTGSLDESLSRLRAASCLVQTALARRLRADRTPAGERPPGAPAETPGGTPEGPRRQGPAPARPGRPRGPDASGGPGPRPGPRERALRRDGPAPGSEPPGPVSSSVFLPSEAAPPDPPRRGPRRAPGSEAAPRPPPRPRDVRKLLKNTYALSFRPPAPAAPPGEPEAPPPEVGRPSPPPPPRFTSTLIRDFLPVVPHPWDGPGPLSSGDSSSSGPSSPDGSSPGRPPPKVYGDGEPPRRKAENITAKPYARSEIRLPGAFPPARPGDPSRAPRAEEPGPPDGSPDESRGPPGHGSPGPASPAPAADREAPTPLRAEAGDPSGPPSAGPSPGPPAGEPGPPRARVPERHGHPAPPGRPPPPRAAVQPAVPSGPSEARPPEPARPAAPPPRAASAPPPVRPGDPAPRAGGLPGRTRGPPGPPPTAPGKVLLDPESGRYYYVESPRQPRVKLLFDPESGQYLEVLLVPYAHCPTLSLPPSPGTLPPRSADLFATPVPAAKLPWGLPGLDPAPLEGLYYLPAGSPAPSPPGGLTPALAHKGSPFRV